MDSLHCIASISSTMIHAVRGSASQPAAAWLVACLLLIQGGYEAFSAMER